ncbi:MAG TPA: thioredoxin domain-containing protein [Candidatus Sulfopaludibacter sp.]|jgi:protein-disulfide isomerase|nr:thioredoxin domain-containing protein [Candidatus Sulfopaludibacter sp.]
MHFLPQRGQLLAAGLLLAGAALLFAQEWQTMTQLPGVDLSKLSPARTNTALRILRNHNCNCGCDMKMAECRAKDPNCGWSRGFSGEVTDAMRAGKDENAAIAAATASRWGHPPAPPKLLDAAVVIPVAGAPVQGPEKAAITLVEFSDFQCPYCAKAIKELDTVLKAYPTQVKLIFKQFPLDSHGQALGAAEAAIAAHQQGKFWQMHDALFASRTNLARPSLLAIATKLGLDMKKFTADLDSPVTRKTVDRDELDGEKAGVEGTPTVFINGQRYNGSLDPQAMKGVLDAELKKVAQKK